MQDNRDLGEQTDLSGRFVEGFVEGFVGRTHRTDLSDGLIGRFIGGPDSSVDGFL